MNNQHILLRQIILYGVIGLLSASFDSCLYIWFTNSFGVNVFLANFISINCGIALSFTLNTFVNFRKTDHIGRRAVRFFAIGYVGLVLSMIILYVGITFMGINDIYVKLFSVVVVATIQFLFNKYISFSDM